MRSHILKEVLLYVSFSTFSRFTYTLGPSLPFMLSSRRNAVSTPLDEEEVKTVNFPRNAPGISYGLNWALANKGVIVKDNAFQNLKSFELKEKGATAGGSLSGVPVHVRGNVFGGTEVSNAQFSQLLKQVTTHISSISNIFVHDGAVGSYPKFDANIRVISDSPSAVLVLSNFLWRTSIRAVSHDPCSLTVYVATSISASKAAISIGIQVQESDGFIIADVKRLSLILCGRAFLDVKGTKEALAAVSGPVISARGGLPFNAKLILSGDSVLLLFATENINRSCSDTLVSEDGVILSSEGVAPFFKTNDSGSPNLFQLPAAVILATSDSSGVIPWASKLSPGQAAYHFLAGYQDGKFVPTYSTSPSAFDPLDLTKALLSVLEDNQIPSFLININEGGRIAGRDVKLLQLEV